MLMVITMIMIVVMELMNNEADDELELDCYYESDDSGGDDISIEDDNMPR
jgi:hypothetical protein